MGAWGITRLRNRWSSGRGLARPDRTFREDILALVAVQFLLK